MLSVFNLFILSAQIKIHFELGIFKDSRPEFIYQSVMLLYHYIKVSCKWCFAWYLLAMTVLLSYRVIPGLVNKDPVTPLWPVLYTQNVRSSEPPSKCLTSSRFCTQNNCVKTKYVYPQKILVKVFMKRSTYWGSPWDEFIPSI